MAVELTARTKETIAHLFSPEKIPLVERLLVEECGGNLPLYKPCTDEVGSQGC